MLPYDVRNFTDPKREELALRIQAATDFDLPELKYWNYDLCKKHRRGWMEVSWNAETKQEEKHLVSDKPFPGCRECGIHFFNHQRVGIMWLYMKKRALLADPMGTGKALAIDEPVLTPLGWRPIGDLKVGDVVNSTTGERSLVLGVYPQGALSAFKVEFNDGTSVTASADHLWTVRAMSNYGQERWQTLTTEQIAEKFLARGHRAFLPEVAPVEMPTATLPIDPYLLGLLLGDGGLTGHSPMLTSADPEIFEYTKQALPQGVCLSVAEHRPDMCPTMRIKGVKRGIPNPLITGLRSIGAWGHGARAKFVPKEYLFSDSAQRLEILRGLMDTDGSAGERQGSLEFGTSSPQLAEDVAFLVRSLGGIARITYRERTESYRVGIGSLRVNPFRLIRKAERFRAPVRYRSKSIISITPTEAAEMVCIKVSAENELFLTAGVTPTHNTAHAAGLIAMLAQTGELRDVGRVVIVPRAPALGQWNKELLRMIPALNVVVANGPKKRRIDEYTKPWHTLLISPQTLINDIELISQFPLALLVTDDVDAIRNPDTKTSWALKSLGMQADRMVIMTGTPLQKRLSELWSTLEPIGGLEAFGTLPVFEANHTRPVLVRERDERTGLVTKVSTVTGYKSLEVVKQKMAPMILRRRIDDLDDINMPEVMPSDVFLDLYPRQRAKYTELRQGVLSIMKEEGMQVKHVTAMSKLIYGAQICGGLASLGEVDDPETSVKMDWIIEKLTNELEDEKVVIFSQFKNSVRALHTRLRNVGIGYETIWGEDKDKASRMRSQERFWTDPDCKVIIGTQAIEQSLNLQVARHLINMDMILNPARMSQLAGRIRRSGSVYRRVFVHNLLTVDTQEEKYLPLLEREAALASHIWDESSELFNQLSAVDMMRLITG